MRANDDYDRSLGWQAHSLEVISQTRSLDAALARAEAALGRFAVGLQKGDGRVYQQQWGVAMQYLRLLQSTVRDTPPQPALVATLPVAPARRGQQSGAAATRPTYNQTNPPITNTQPPTRPGREACRLPRTARRAAWRRGAQRQLQPYHRRHFQI